VDHHLQLLGLICTCETSTWASSVISSLNFDKKHFSFAWLHSDAVLFCSLFLNELPSLLLDSFLFIILVGKLTEMK
jgi:hypothetical protein